MLSWLIPLIALIISVAILLFLSIKNIGKVAAIDTSTDPNRVKNERKRSMYMKRLERIGGEKTSSVKRTTNKLWLAIKKTIKKLYSKAQAMERHYKRLQKEEKDGVAGTHEVRKNLMQEASELIAREAYTGAEQRLIELLSLDPKNAKIYEMLGGVYMKMKKWTEAKETLQYAHQVAQEDASVITSLGELAMRDANHQEAVEYFNKAVDLKPKNTKYIDYLIESSILAEDRSRAIKGLKQMKQTNPQNKKIQQFESQIANIKRK